MTYLKDSIVKGDAFISYLENKELSDNTIKCYSTAISQYFEQFAEISKKSGMVWRQQLQESGLKPKSINVKINGYNAFCDFIGKPDAKCKTLKVHSATAISNVISKKDYERLLQGLLDDKNLRWYYNIKLLAVTGARVSEYIRLKKSDFERGYAEMWTKGKIRRIYIPKSFKEEAELYYSNLYENEYLASGRFEGITSRGGAQALKRFSKKYGIDEAVMHPHSFRHMFAISFLEQNNNLSLLADIMGHSSVATTAIYTRLTKEQQISAINATVNW